MADIFFELNASARDVGVHASLDATSWKELEILDPRGRQVVEVKPRGGARQIGLTELFFEGEEPSLREVPFSRFLALFPQGRYIFRGITTDNQPLRSTDSLTADLPCPVRLTTPAADGRVSLDALTVRWTAPSGTYEPDRQFCRSRDSIRLSGFQVVVEIAKEERDFLREFSVVLSPRARQVRVPAQFLREAARFPDTILKVEVLALERSGNKTITEQPISAMPGFAPPRPATDALDAAQAPRADVDVEMVPMRAVARRCERDAEVAARRRGDCAQEAALRAIAPPARGDRDGAAASEREARDVQRPSVRVQADPPGVAGHPPAGVAAEVSDGCDAAAHVGRSRPPGVRPRNPTRRRAWRNSSRAAGRSARCPRRAPSPACRRRTARVRAPPRRWPPPAWRQALPCRRGQRGGRASRCRAGSAARRRRPQGGSRGRERPLSRRTRLRQVAHYRLDP